MKDSPKKTLKEALAESAQLFYKSVNEMPEKSSKGNLTQGDVLNTLLQGIILLNQQLGLVLTMLNDKKK